MSGVDYDWWDRLTKLAEAAFRAAVHGDGDAVAEALAAIDEMGPDWVMVARLFTAPLHEVLRGVGESIGGHVVEVMPSVDPETEKDHPRHAYVHRFVAASFNNNVDLCKDLFWAFADAHWDEETHGASEAVMSVLVGVSSQFTAAGREAE